MYNIVWLIHFDSRNPNIEGGNDAILTIPWNNKQGETEVGKAQVKQKAIDEVLVKVRGCSWFMSSSSCRNGELWDGGTLNKNNAKFN